MPEAVRLIRSVRCPKCGEHKSTADFHVNRSRACGRECWCKTCRRQYQAKRYPIIRERVRLEHIHDPRPSMLYAAKRRAQIRGLEFSIKKDDITVPEICPVLGLKLEVGAGTASESSPTLDRIHQDRGYVPGNVAVISGRANRLKDDATYEEMLLLVSYVERHR